MKTSCNNKAVNSWVQESVAWLAPSEVVWINGSDVEYAGICEKLVSEGKFVPLNQKEYPNSFWSRSHPGDVARVEERTFICTPTKEQAGPTNNWAEPGEMMAKLRTSMQGAMKGRTMYVIPYLMGPAGSKYAKVGFELTDSAYVVANMRIMARVGDIALNALSDSSTDFVRGVHSYGTLDKENRYICHFPEDRTIISFNSDYGGNALQGKKCFALRIASYLGKQQGWLAEHMLIVGLQAPSGEKRYIAAAFPSACGKTNLAMLIPPKEYLDAGWKVTTVGDDIAWLNFGEDGQLYAINPEAGFFGVAPGTSSKTNANALATCSANTIFTNTAFDSVNRVPWWEGLSPAPAKLIDWLGNEWSVEGGTKAAHPNSRFTAPVNQCPSLDSEWQNPNGVPISAIVFGGRRARVAPLVVEAFNWQHGTYMGTTMASEMTAAAEGTVGKVRRDPMAMLPFIGYHVGEYFKHWLEMGKKGATSKLPKIFQVNWFRTDTKGNFLWPGFGDNMRVLEWIFDRSAGRGEARETQIGLMPTEEGINLSGLSITRATIEELFAVNVEEWLQEVKSQREFLATVGDKLPAELLVENDALMSRLG